jgi:hypothetical protein
MKNLLKTLLHQSKICICSETDVQIYTYVGVQIIIGYNITSGMIIIDDIMSEIELEISRVRRTSEMSCFNFTNLISSMINHTTCYIQ